MNVLNSPIKIELENQKNKNKIWIYVIFKVYIE